MKLISNIKTKGEAIQIAIDWQSKQSNQSMSYGEVIMYLTYFEKLAKKFNLIREFKENGIL
jgi:hypothetical protein